MVSASLHGEAALGSLSMNGTHAGGPVRYSPLGPVRQYRQKLVLWADADPPSVCVREVLWICTCVPAGLVWGDLVFG